MIVHHPQMMIVELPVDHVMTVANKAQKAVLSVNQITEQKKTVILKPNVQIPAVLMTVTGKFYH